MDTGFKDDYVQLDGSQKIFVDKAPDRIKMRGMESRQPLHSNLVKCNKLKTKKWVFELFSGKLKTPFI